MKRTTLERIVSIFRDSVSARKASQMMEIAASAKRPFLTDPTAIQLNVDAGALRGSQGVAVIADATRLPFSDHSFDLVVGAFVFCSINDPDRAARELERVLMPNGRYLLLEHVRATTLTGRLCQSAAVPWHRIMGAGCSLTRNPHVALAAAGFELVAAKTWPDWVEPIMMAEYRKR